MLIEWDWVLILYIFSIDSEATNAFRFLRMNIVVRFPNS